MNYKLTNQDIEVKQAIGVLLELLGEDFEIICTINGFLDLPSSDALPTLNHRISELQKKTGNYGPYIAEPINLNDEKLNFLMDKINQQMIEKEVKVICKR